jgi:capsular polysaccharide biosynthesis protein
MGFEPNLSLKHCVLDEATVLSFGSGKNRGVSRPAGVFAADGRYEPMGQCWRDSKGHTTAPTVAPRDEDISETLGGTWLFGGMLYAHFGHFLCESTARLWALDLPDNKIDGVIFHPKARLPRMSRLLQPTKPWLMVAGCTLPVVAPPDPVRVERLIVPEQGFGTGDMVAGRPEYRDFVRRHFGAQIGAEGGEKLYISRSQLYSKRGRILGETFLETALAREGYDIFHPQEHPIEVQVARYKAARHVISTDCSALHLSALFAKPTDRVAILARRPGPTIGDFQAQYHAFCGLEPVIVNHLTAMHSLEGAKLAQMSETYAEADFAMIQQSLLAGGFITDATPWARPSAADLKAELDIYAEKQGAAMQEIAL